MKPTSDTIAAIATAPGRGGVGIVRVSGTQLLPFARQISGKNAITPRYAHYCVFRDEDGGILDDGLLLYFPAPASFTGEDVIELHGHGGTVAPDLLLQRCLKLGARMAQPGEFSQRAFLNGKIDLAQAESIADLIDAAGKTAARMAQRSLQGVFSAKIRAAVDELITLRMLVEATLDFPEEEIDFLQAAAADDKLSRLEKSLENTLQQAVQGARLRDGMNVVLIGAPNVGKSSLMNALAGGEVAIVTDIAGTTRDTLREEILLDGIALHITDTAGLRETDDTVEKIGIERARRAVENADIALILTDCAESITPAVRAIIDTLPEDLAKIEIRNKIDLHGESPYMASGSLGRVIALSAKTGAGLDLLKNALLENIGWQGESEGLFLARRRHVDAITQALAEIRLARAQTLIDLAAEHLRRAQNYLNTVTGEFGADDLLGEIFSRFCIGK